jgi:hypothetical protein
VLTAFESIIGRRRGGDGRRGAIVLAAALAVFFAALVFSLSSAYGAPKATLPPEKATTNQTTKTKPKVKASIRRGQLDVLGTAKSDRITLRLKPGNKSRLQVVGGNGSAEFTFTRSPSTGSSFTAPPAPTRSRSTRGTECSRAAR